MPHTVTETDTFPATITVPNDGDDLDAASVEGAAVGFDGIVNRTRYLFNRLRHSGDFEWSGQLSCATGDTNVVVGPIHSLLIGNKLFSTSGNTSIPLAGVLSGWHVIYAYNNAGSLAFEAPSYGSSPPDAGLLFKDGDPNYRYIGVVRANGSNNPMPFRATRGEYLWRVSSGENHKLLAGGTLATFQNLSLATRVPPHGKSAILRLNLNAVGGSSGAWVRTNGDTANTADTVISLVAASGETNGIVEKVETDSAQTIQWLVTNASVGFLDIFVRGWQE
jgi:hypothetical protein